MSPQPIFNEADFRRLDQLGLRVARLRAGQQLGERRSRRKGSSLEFADYRSYVAGDDLRRLDWNLYARLDKPFVKLFEAEEDLSVHILLDCSSSMHWPPPDDPDYAPQHHKLRFAAQVAAALAYIALGQGDRVQLAAFRAGQVTDQLTRVRGKANIQHVCHWLEKQLTPTNTPIRTDLNLALQHYAQQTKHAGMLVLLSDMLDASNYKAGLDTLLQRTDQVLLVHTLAPAEIAPPWQGDWQLQDSESHTTQELTLDSEMQTKYKQTFAAWQAEIARLWQQSGARYAMASTEQVWYVFVMDALRKLGLVN